MYSSRRFTRTFRRRKIEIDKYGYAVITTIEYRSLIEDINNKKERINKVYK